MGRPPGSRNRTTKPKSTPAPKAKKPPKAKGSVPGDNSPPPGISADEVRSLYLADVTKMKKLLDAKDSAVAAIRNCAKQIIAKGHYTVKQVQRGIKLQTPEGEEALRDEMIENIQAAAWIGSPIGTQFSFELVDRTPAVDRAYDEGFQASADNQPRTPPYDPNVPQYATWLDGYAAHQATLAQGFQPLDGDDFEEDPPRTSH